MIKVTQEQANTWLSEDIGEARGCLNRNTKVKLTQNEIDALISFIYNSGCRGFCRIDKSGVDNALCNGNYHQAIQRMRVYNNNGDLATRREREISIFMDASY